jgi:hypothetical protein
MRLAVAGAARWDDRESCPPCRGARGRFHIVETATPGAAARAALTSIYAPLSLPVVCCFATEFLGLLARKVRFTSRGPLLPLHSLSRCPTRGDRLMLGPPRSPPKISIAPSHWALPAPDCN